MIILIKGCAALLGAAQDVSMGNYNSSWRQASTRGRRAGTLLGTPRYGEVFLKVAWRGVGPTPLKPWSQWIPSTPNRQTNFLLISQKGLAENLASAPPLPQEDAKGLAKIWPGLPRPLAGGLPEGVVLCLRRSGDVPLWGSICNGWYTRTKVLMALADHDRSNDHMVI